MDFQKKRFQFIGFIVAVIALSFTAEKCRQMVGERGSSQSGQFTIFNCLDGGSGTLACVVKEGVKLYTYNIRTLHVEVARNKAIESSIADAISQGMDAQTAAKQAQKDGAKAAKLATKKAKRIIGPIISSGWDFFEAIYYGGTITEGFLRGTGTLFGTYGIGYLGEERFGRFGYLIGSQFGSWIGGRIGLMVYDIVNGVHFLLDVGQSQTEENGEQIDSFQFGQSQVEENGEQIDSFQFGQTVEDIKQSMEQIENGASFLETIMGYMGSYISQSSSEVESGVVEEAVVDEADVYETPDYESFESNEEL